MDLNHNSFKVSFFLLGIFVSLFPSDVDAEGCNVVIVRSLGSKDVIENYDSENADYELRIFYYEKFYTDFDPGSSRIYLLPSDNKQIERVQIMTDYGIRETGLTGTSYEKYDSADFDGIGTPEDIFRFLSEGSERQGSDTIYFYTAASADRVNHWKGYWIHSSQNPEYVNKMHAILQNLIPSTGLRTDIQERAHCEKINVPSEGIVRPIDSDTLASEIGETRISESADFSQILSWIYLSISIISSFFAIIIFILYRKKYIFQR